MFIPFCGSIYIWLETTSLWVSFLLKRGWRRTNIHQIHLLKCVNKYLKMYLKKYPKEHLKTNLKISLNMFFQDVSSLLKQATWNHWIQEKTSPGRARTTKAWSPWREDVVSEIWMIWIWPADLDIICHPPMFFSVIVSHPKKRGSDSWWLIIFFVRGCCLRLTFIASPGQFFWGISLANSLVCHQPGVKLLSLEMIVRNWMPDFCFHLLTLKASKAPGKVERILSSYVSQDL